MPGVTYETEAEAWNALADYETDRRRGVERTAPSEAMLVDFAWLWHGVHTMGRPANTRTDYANMIRNGLTRPGTPLHGIRVADITPLRVREWLAALSTPWTDERGKSHPGYGPSSQTKAFRVLSLVMDAAVGEGLRDANPCTGIQPVTRGARQAGRREHYYLYLSEVARIIAAADYIPQRAHEDWGLFFEVLAWTGMRPQEIRALAPAQIHVEGGFLLIDAAISDGSKKADQERAPTKSGLVRLAYCPAPVIDRLTKRVADRSLGRSDLVFPGEDQVSPLWPSAYNRLGWIPMCGVAGVGPDSASLLRGRRSQPVPYDLRSAFISHMRSAGVPHIDVSAQVGHQDEAVTDLYTVVAASGREDPIAVAARQVTDRTRAGVVDYLYTEAQATLG